MVTPQPDVTRTSRFHACNRSQMEPEKKGFRLGPAGAAAAGRNKRARTMARRLFFAGAIPIFPFWAIVAFDTAEKVQHATLSLCQLALQLAPLLVQVGLFAS